MLLLLNPHPLLVDIGKVGNNLTALGSGGTPAYNYAWSNGVTGPGNNNISAGKYSVTITDSRGWASTQNFILSAHWGRKRNKSGNESIS